MFGLSTYTTLCFFLVFMYFLSNSNWRGNREAHTESEYPLHRDYRWGNQKAYDESGIS